MDKRELFPIIDQRTPIGQAAETIALHKARGAIVRDGTKFELVGWRDVAHALEHAGTFEDLQTKPLGAVASVPIDAPDGPAGAIAPIDIHDLTDLRDSSAFTEARLYRCTCGYRSERPRDPCPANPCRQSQV
jgi:hypothetical protein